MTRYLSAVLCLVCLSACSSPPEPVPPAPTPEPVVIVIPTPVPLTDVPIEEPDPAGGFGIIGGTVAKPGEYPSVAWSGSCTGTLIAPRWVLTAAHCKPGKGMKWTFTLPDGKARTYTADAGFIHPSFRASAFSLGNDIALSRLTEDVLGITPAKLNATVPAPKQKLTIVGWGLTGTGVTGQASGAGTKRIGSQTIDFVLAPHVLWMFDKGEVSTIAQGDSGGPAFAAGTDTVVGVASGVSAGAGGKLGVFGTYAFETRVDVHRPWVTSVTGNAN